MSDLLFVSPRFLFPADSGGKIRTTQVLKGMLGGRFRVTLASPAPRGAVDCFSRELGSVCDEFRHWPDHRETLAYRLRRLASVAAHVPVAVASDRSSEGRRVVADCLSRCPSVVVFDFPHSVVLAPDRFETASVIFTHNVESWIFERHVQVAGGPLSRALWSDQLRKMLRFERHALGRFDAVVAVSEKDAGWFREMLGLGNVSVIPTGVDLEYFKWQAPTASNQVVFIGSMDWPANQDGIRFLLDEVWPQVERAVPGATMKVIGRSPPGWLVAKAPQRSWRFTGFVDDVRPHAQGSAVSVIPLRVGGGTRIKAYEAMAMGIPVVSTSIGIEGLPVNADEHYLRADDATTFAAAVIRMLQNHEIGTKLSERARALVESKYSNREVARIFESICAEVARLPPRSTGWART